MTLWTFDEIAEATKARGAFGEGAVFGISIDSRNIQKGDLFIAIDGEHTDGHQYVAMALEKGASAALVHKDVASASCEKLLIVQDTTQGLYDLAKAARLRMRGQRIAITGSVGKTGLKEALAHILQDQGVIHYTQGNLNNHFGLPLTLCRMPKQTDFGIFEIGMNHAGEITPLVQLLQPHIAVITAISEAHAAFFKNTAEIAKAKAEIFLGFDGEGRVLLPNDCPEADLLTRWAIDADVSTITNFGQTTNCNYCARNIHNSITGSSFDFHMDFGDRIKNVKAKTQTWGQHYVLTAVAALGSVDLLGADMDKAVQRLRSFTNPIGRGAITKVSYHHQNIYLVDDAYNANEASMKAALSLFIESDILPAKRYAILGEMLELGTISERAHLALEASILAANLKKLWLVGHHMYPLYCQIKEKLDVTYIKDIDSLMGDIEPKLPSEAWLLVKGSHGSQVYQIVDKLMQN